MIIHDQIEAGKAVSTTFEDVDGKTKIIKVFDCESLNSVEIQRVNWQVILNSFKKYLESS